MSFAPLFLKVEYMYSKPLIHNYGATKTFVQSNGQNHMNKIKWKLDYDGSNVHGDVAVKSDGQRKHYKINMDNNDLTQLLGSQKYSEPIHKRLENELFSQNPTSLVSVRPHEFIMNDNGYNDSNNNYDNNGYNDSNNNYDNALNNMIQPFSDVQYDMTHVTPKVFIIHTKHGRNGHSHFGHKNFPKDSLLSNYKRLKPHTHRMKRRRLRRQTSRKTPPLNKTYRVKMGHSRGSKRNSKRSPLVKLTDIND